MSDLQALKIDRSAQTRRARRSRRGGLGWLVLALLLLAIGWLFRGPLVATIDRLRLPEVRVVVARAERGAAASAVSGTAANGYVVAGVRAALSADTPGRIVEMNVTEGSVVKKGDVVARLYADEYRAELRRAEADLEAARAAVARAEADREVTRTEIDRRTLEAEAAQATLEEARATQRLAQRTLRRTEGLVEGRVRTEQELDEARAELERAASAEEAAQREHEAARAAVVQARASQAASAAAVTEAEARVPVAAARRDLAAATLEKTQVRAPFDGIVVLKDAEVGEVVSPNAVGSQSRGSVVTMVDFASLEVQVEVPETSLAAVRVGAPARVFLDAWPTVPYAGRVERIWPTANRQKATVEVRVGFDEPDDRLRPEMGVRVVFTDEEAESAPAEARPEGLLLPATSVVRVDGREGVFVLERDVARYREVRTASARGERVLVTAGIEEGERVIAAPPVSLTDGDRVRLAE